MTWPVLALGEVCTSIRNGIFARRPTDEPGGSRILRISAVRDGKVNLNDSRFVDGLEPSQVSKFSVHPGDLLMTRYNGSRALVGISGLVSEHSDPVVHPDKLIRIVLDTGRILPAFANYQLSSPAVRSHLEPRIRTTAGQSGIAGPDVRSIPLAVPSLEEQRRIVNLLEDHLSRLDAADKYLDTARRREALLRDQLLVSLLSAVSCGNVPLRDVLTAGLSNGRSVTTQDGGFPVLRLTALRDGRIDLAERKAGAWTAEEAARFLVKKGDFLISRGNGSLRLVGRGGLVVDDPDPVAYPDTLIRARPAADKIVPDYLALVWNAPDVRRQIEKAAKTTAGIYKVNQKDLAAIRLPVPALADQVQVVDAVAASREALGRLSGEVRAAGARSVALRRSLLAAAFSGRLVSTRPDRIDTLT